MRRFRYGRVDNIRAATPEALRWVKSMVDPNAIVVNCAPKRPGLTLFQELRRDLFREAAAKQALVTQEVFPRFKGLEQRLNLVQNISGYGIDNHLCAMDVLARQAAEQREIPDVPELFRQPMWKELMRFPLTTSQVGDCREAT